MTYENLESLPADVKALPSGGQQIFMAAFNAATSDGMDAEKATETAWNSVKTKYEQTLDGSWQLQPEGGTGAGSPTATQTSA